MCTLTELVPSSINHHDSAAILILEIIYIACTVNYYVPEYGVAGIKKDNDDDLIITLCWDTNKIWFWNRSQVRMMMMVIITHEDIKNDFELA